MRAAYAQGFGMAALWPRKISAIGERARQRCWDWRVPLMRARNSFPMILVCRQGCPIKGKLAYRAWPFHIGIYTEGCGSYQRTKHPQCWFCSEEEAQEAGFRKSLTCWW
jgi:hypothetical protein